MADVVAQAIPLLSLFLSLSIRLTNVPENAALKHVVAGMAAYFIDVAAIVSVVAGNMRKIIALNILAYQSTLFHLVYA